MGRSSVRRRPFALGFSAYDRDTELDVIQIDEDFRILYNYVGRNPTDKNFMRYLSAAMEKIHVETGVVTQLGEGSKTPHHNRDPSLADSFPVLHVNTKDYPSTYEGRVKVAKALGLSSDAIVKAYPITYK